MYEWLKSSPINLAIAGDGLRTTWGALPYRRDDLKGVCRVPISHGWTFFTVSCQNCKAPNNDLRFGAWEGQSTAPSRWQILEVRKPSFFTFSAVAARLCRLPPKGRKNVHECCAKKIFTAHLRFIYGHSCHAVGFFLSATLHECAWMAHE